MHDRTQPDAFEGLMAGKKGPLDKIADAVSDAVQAVAAGVGLAPEPEPAPQPKAARKAARKALVARVTESKKGTRRAKRSTS
jgi:hypothetical protein